MSCSDGESVFDERRGLVFKELHVVRFFDKTRNVLVYVSYSDRLIEGSPKNSISTVPIMGWVAPEAPRWSSPSPDDCHYYEPSAGHGLPHDPMNSIVGPRPIGWVSTLGSAGVRNLAPYSFFSMFCYRPPIIGFCSTSPKDSLRNVRETGEFVWNLATRDLADRMNASSAAVAYDVDEFELAGLTPAPSGSCARRESPRAA